MHCTIDRVGSIRIVHVFDRVNERTSRELLQMLFDVARETDGRLVVSFLESPEIDLSVAQLFAESARALGPRVTLVGAKLPCGRGLASCFGEVFAGTTTTANNANTAKTQ